MEYRHTADMQEISGFGGSYEESCQDMLEAGLRWIEKKRKEKEPNFSWTEYAGVTGFLLPESDDAKELSAVVEKACAECTGAMHHTVMSRLFWIAKSGWEAYKKELIERKRKKDG